MKRLYKIALICVLISGLCLPCWADPPASMKINPQAIDYPLIRASLYYSKKDDPYERSFGIDRWLNPLKMRHNPRYEMTVSESQEWFQRYSGYGVTGHGEDVFTRQGAQFRRIHRGR